MLGWMDRPLTFTNVQKKRTKMKEKRKVKHENMVDAKELPHLSSVCVDFKAGVCVGVAEV